MTRNLLTLALIYCLTLAFASCREKNYVNSGTTWGTTYNISYTAPRDLGDSIIAVMAQIDSELSMFNPSSTVSQINNNTKLEASPMFVDVFNLSVQISRLSGGMFDPTVGPLTDLWGFGRRQQPDSLIPTTAEIDNALDAVGIADCRIDNRRVLKKSPATIFDFSSVAKGYGVDQVAEMLRRNGASSYLVEIGGEISASAARPDGRLWHIQIDAPIMGDDIHSRMYLIELSQRSVATSGNYRKFRQTADGIVGHTLDPLTGRPVVSSTLSATVIAPDCATADALATACMAMNADSALTMIEALPDVEALIAVARSDTLTILKTSSFPSPLK